MDDLTVFAHRGAFFILQSRELQKNTDISKSVINKKKSPIYALDAADFMTKHCR
jgi:hypothetical protein